MTTKIKLYAVHFFFCFALLMASKMATAEQSVVFGDYTIHYIAVNSTFIDPDIAEEYNILRSDRRAFLNISVLKNSTTNNYGSPVSALISGTKKNLLGQNQNIDFVMVTEGDAIYYIGQFEFSNAEKARFEIEVQPEGIGRSRTIKWSSTLYNN